MKVVEKDAQPDSGMETTVSSREEELLHTLQRVQADFENYRKRAQHENSIHYTRGKASAFKEMLSVLDTLDSAITKEKNETQKALENIRMNFLNVLKQNGVKPIETIGKPFDPFTSECLLQGNDTQRGEDEVLEEIQKGYYFHEDVLRPAKVKVNKRTENDYQSSTNEGGNKNE